MIHLGDITKISGYDVPPVDCVIGGSPCQDLSVANGKRAGLAGERSGLFAEQIRLVKEMRDADRLRGRTGQFIRPRYMVWENVPGAFSSNHGEDFRAVLEETVRIAEPEAPDVPLPPKGKWPLADAYYGDGWSVAYRVFDAQFWGVPQRRRRIALVADFGGQSAPEILFERARVSWDTPEGATAGQAVTAGAGRGADKADTAGGAVTLKPTVCAGFKAGNGPKTNGIGYEPEKAPTLSAASSGTNQVPAVFDARGPGLHGEVACTLDASYYKGPGERNGLEREVVFDARGNGDGETVPTITGDHENRVTDYTALVMPFDATQITSKQNGSHPRYGAPCHPLAAGAYPPTIVMATGQGSAEITADKSPTLNCNHEEPVIVFDKEVYNSGTGASGGHYISEGGPAPTMRAHKPAGVCSAGTVRRLTPMECERLQGLPDRWTDIGDWTDEKGKRRKRRKTSDAARYKAIGNSIALPPWKWVLKRLCALYERDATMASLFDGIGGFPRIWEQLNGPGTCLWASEIDSYCVAVTKRRFNGE